MSRQLSTARTEVLDDGRRRRYCRIIFAGCCSQPPPHRPMWSVFESAVPDHGSFPFSNHFLVVCWCDVTSAKRQPNRTAPRSQARRRSDRARHVQSSRCHGGTPVRSRCVGRCAQRAHSPLARAASTLGMGRRIMAERRRPRTGRGRHWRARARVKDGPNGNSADASLRAFVRALALQAARECFELELKQRSRTIQ